MSDKIITVTSPLLPSLDEFEPLLKDIWERKWLTNNGYYHKQLEAALAEYLGVEYISLFTNGTLPLITALQAMRITGEVITTPYSFVATTHSIWWNGLTPVFVDVDPATGNLDPQKIEEAITPKTTAIMPVHVYGNPCDIEAIQEIADRYGLAVIYDAAHAFNVKVNGRTILDAGDMNTLSFHATKTYNTVEGGALKNFGFAGETTVVAPGINSKMDEIRSAYGLCNLKHIDDAIADRKKVAAAYRKALANIPGITMFKERDDVTYNYSYFPIFVNEAEYGMSRDSLYEKMKSQNVLGRRYFYPLISSFAIYRGLPSASKENLPVATRMADEVICLPMHAGLTNEDVSRVLELVQNKGNL